VLVTKNNLRFKRIIENNTVNAKWFEMGSDPAAVINTLKYRNNTVITYAQAQAIFDRATASRATLSQTDFTTQTATWFALQRAINFCLASGNKLYIPAGQYTVSKGLLVADLGNYISGFEIQGAATTYNGSASQTVLNFTNKENFGIGFHRVKGLRVRNLFLKGQDKVNLKNNDQDPVTLYDYFENPDMDWTHGCRDHVWSPHAGFVVDPFFNQGQGGEAEMYPGFTSFYADPDGSGGSTDVIFDNCRVEQFVVGYCFSPHNAPQNGDNIAVNNSWVNYCKSGISIGQSQNRSVAVNNLKCWGGVETLFDSQRYGDTYSADFVEVDQLQIAGGVKFLVRSGGWINKGLQIRRMHAELLYSLGSVNTASHQLGLMIDDSWIHLVGSMPGESVHPARCAFSGSGLKITNSFFGQYQGANALPITISTPYAVFEKCSFYEGVVGLMPSNVGELDLYQGFTDFRDYKGARFRSHYAAELHTGGFAVYDIFLEGSYLEIDRYYLSYAYRRYPALLVDSNTKPYFQNFFTFKLDLNVQLSSINTATQEASFTITPTSDDYRILRVGDPLYSKDDIPNETGEISTFLLGRVKSKNDATGSVTIEGAAKGIDLVTSYPITIRRYKYAMPSFILGNTTAGTNTVKNCFGESGVIKDYTGYTLQSPYFPKGTYIASVDGVAGIITMSNNATATINGAEIIGANWNAIEYGTYPDTWPHVCCYQAYKKGDVIYNTDMANYPDVEKWVCTKSGLTGSIFVPEFNTTTMDVSSKFTGNTTIINGQVAVSKGRFISNIVVSTDKAISSIKIGTSPGGSDVLAGGSTTSVAANTTKVIAINKYYNRRPSGPGGPDGTTTMTLYVQFTQSSTTTATINMLISK
jgi:hypothetical protein